MRLMVSVGYRRFFIECSIRRNSMDGQSMAPSAQTLRRAAVRSKQSGKKTNIVDRVGGAWCWELGGLPLGSHIFSILSDAGCIMHDAMMGVRHRLVPHEAEKVVKPRKRAYSGGVAHCLKLPEDGDGFHSDYD